MDVVVVVERQEFVTGELCPVVGDDGVWNPKPVDDISEEQYRLLGFDLSDQTASIHLENLSMATNKWV